MHDIGLRRHSRRGALAALGGALLCPLCIAQGARASGSGQEAAHWSYEGETGAEHWGELSAENRVCSMGMEQTPIDLVGAMRAGLAPVEASVAQIRQFAEPFPMTARPAQPRHRRFLLESA